VEVLSLLLDAGANVYKTDGGDHRDEGSEGSLKKDVNKRIDKMKAKVSRDVEKVKKIAHEVNDKVKKTATDIGTGIHEAIQNPAAAAEKVKNKFKKDAEQFKAKATKANNKLKEDVGKIGKAFRRLRPNTFLEMNGVENPDSNVLMYHAKFEKNSAAQQELDAIIKKNTAEEGIAQYPHIHAVLQSLSGESSFFF
jgi:hypothetical protein